MNFGILNFCGHQTTVLIASSERNARGWVIDPTHPTSAPPLRYCVSTTSLFQPKVSSHQSMSSSNYRRDFPRGRGRGKGRGSEGLNSVIGINGDGANGGDFPRSLGRGRGRGIGRGVDRTMPAWMKEHKLYKYQRDIESLDLKGVEKKKNSERSTVPKTDERVNFDKDLTEIESIEVDEYEIKRQQILEQQELERVADEFTGSNNDDTYSNAFETEKENDERLARERREKRKRRLKQLQSEEGESKLKKPKVQDASIQNELLEDTSGNGNKNELPTVNKDLNSHAKDDTIVGNSPRNESTGNSKDSSGADSFDMFSSSVSPVMKIEEYQKKAPATAASKGVGLDDAEGYYRATIGEVISFARPRKDSSSASAPLSFRVQGIIGKGVFSTVLKCSRMKQSTELDENRQVEDKDIIAMKLIRANETMARAAQKEVRILRLIHNKKSKKEKLSTDGEASSSIAKKFIVKMLEPEDFEVCSPNGHNKNISMQERLQQPLLEHHNHTALLFEHLPFNLRECLSKFGKNVGISLGAVRSYTKQLLNALKHLAAHRIVHADIKLDNILVSSNFSTVKICDFGSSFLETDGDNDPTPYLVSRFYRAPEVILGLEYDHMIDLWSVAVSMAELFTGNVLFPGRTNNDMLHKIMQCVGPVSNKLIKRHIACFTRLGLDPHFEAVATGVSNFNFRQQDIDKVTGKPVIRVLDLNSAGSNSIGVGKKQITQVLLKSRSTSDGRGEVIKFSTFLLRCLALDSIKRISLDDAFAHEFLTSNGQ